LLADEVTLRGALLLVLLIFFALVAGVDAAAHIPMNVSAKSVTPKIHFEKFGFLLISILLVEAFVREAEEAASILTSICWTRNIRVEGIATLGEHVGLLNFLG